MTGLSVDADDAETERYGKTVSDLQTDVVVNGNSTITGTLKHVTGYTGFSGDTELQSGNYLALAFDADDGAEISVTLGTRGPVDLTDDMFLVARITDTSEVLTVTAVKSGHTEVKAYDLSRLVCETE